MCVIWTFMSQISPFPKLKGFWLANNNEPRNKIHPQKQHLTLVPLPSCCKPISIMWVYKIKQDANNKVQLIVWNFNQGALLIRPWNKM